METMKQSGLWSSQSTHGFLVVIWWLCISGSGETGKFDFSSWIWPWRARSIALQNYRDLNRCILNLWSKFGILARMCDELWCRKWVKFCLWPYIWPWKSRSIAPQNNRYLNQVVLHLWFKFGDPSLNGSRELSREQASDWHTDWHTHGHTHRDAGNDNTRRPKLAWGEN